MFHSRKNINIIVGLLAVLHLLFFNSKAIAIDNVTQNKAVFSVTSHNSLLPANYNQQKTNKNDLIKTPRLRRKNALNETNDSLITSDKSISFYFTSTIIVVNFKNQLSQASVSLPLLRGPPIV